MPYLWAGTSIKGVDCSGFSKSVYFLNGYMLLRNASQQYKTGEPVDVSQGLDNLQPADLVFFGREATEDKPGLGLTKKPGIISKKKGNKRPIGLKMNKKYTLCPKRCVFFFITFAIRGKHEWHVTFLQKE